MLQLCHHASRRALRRGLACQRRRRRRQRRKRWWCGRVGRFNRAFARDSSGIWAGSATGSPVDQNGPAHRRQLRQIARCASHARARGVSVHQCLCVGGGVSSPLIFLVMCCVVIIAGGPEVKDACAQDQHPVRERQRAANAKDSERETERKTMSKPDLAWAFRFVGAAGTLFRSLLCSPGLVSRPYARPPPPLKN